MIFWKKEGNSFFSMLHEGVALIQVSSQWLKFTVLAWVFKIVNFSTLAHVFQVINGKLYTVIHIYLKTYEEMGALCHGMPDLEMDSSFVWIFF